MTRNLKEEGGKPYLQAGIMINGVTFDSEEGTPQGGPLSPLLSIFFWMNSIPNFIKVKLKHIVIR
ncbi:hypothetical protein E6W99_02730 [Metabacillus sediminilitoris]|uniref:Reverse transcriptase domain-containing protein n=1 Tax=Metabacillus sediminilitoris TaxID=2567941 RepID=A0A4S4C565_9BACI|nr:hypothetical protein E6W99_02730 [Metabacillus sediminilitoris]